MGEGCDRETEGTLRVPVRGLVPCSRAEGECGSWDQILVDLSAFIGASLSTHALCVRFRMANV